MFDARRIVFVSRVRSGGVEDWLRRSFFIGKLPQPGTHYRINPCDRYDQSHWFFLELS